MQVVEFHAAVRDLNREVRRGAYAMSVLRKLPPEDWESIFAATPQWRSFGVIEALTCEAHEALDRNPAAAHAITQLILRQLEALHVPPSLLVFLPRLKGSAWKEHASACFMLKDFAGAVSAAKHSYTIFAQDPTLAVERSRATFVIAQALNEQGHREEALRLLLDCERTCCVFDERTLLLAVMMQRAMIFFDANDVIGARDEFKRAHAEATRQRNPRELAAAEHGLGACALETGDVPEAIVYLKNALLRFMQLGKVTEANRSIWIMSLATSKLGDVASAVAELERARDEFSACGMTAVAQQVERDIATIKANEGGDR